MLTITSCFCKHVWIFWTVGVGLPFGWVLYPYTGTPHLYLLPPERSQSAVQRRQRTC